MTNKRKLYLVSQKSQRSSQLHHWPCSSSCFFRSYTLGYNKNRVRSGPKVTEMCLQIEGERRSHQCLFFQFWPLQFGFIFYNNEMVTTEIVEKNLAILWMAPQVLIEIKNCKISVDHVSFLKNTAQILSERMYFPLCNNIQVNIRLVWNVDRYITQS